MIDVLKKVVFVYLGGLDILIILKWLQIEYGCEVIIFIVDLGQGEELEFVCVKVELLGIKLENIYIVDVCEEFVCDFVFLMFCVNVLYEGLYLLGILIVCLLILKYLVEIVYKYGVDVVVYGVIGKGNDQVWFEFSVYVLDFLIKVIVFWWEWDLILCIKFLEFVEVNQILIVKDKCGEVLFSVDVNLLYILSEGKVLENFVDVVLEYVYQCIVLFEEVLDQLEFIEIIFEKGDVIVINGQVMSLVMILIKLNELGGKYGIGCLDFVENCFVGMKLCGIYEIFGGIVLLEVYCGIEQIMLDVGVGYLKDLIMLCYVELIYNGFWFSFECEMLQVLIDKL